MGSPAATTSDLIMPRIAIASSSALAADASLEVAELGGNAVDAAVAASLVQLVSEPGVVSLGAGALALIRAPGETPVMIDGASEMPGRSAPRERFGQGGLDVILPYGGGTPTTVGHASVATPGAIAGYALAAERYGRVAWRDLVEPARRCAAAGFALPLASWRYLEHTRAGIFGWNPAAMAPLQHRDGTLLDAGDTVFIEHLADTLAEIADEGAAAFYRGDIARRMADEVQSNAGLLALDDLQAYQPRAMPALEVVVDDWHLATAGAPSVGGAAIAAMLLLLRGAPKQGWTEAMTRRLIEAQSAVLGYREQHLDTSLQLERDVAALVDMARRSPSGLHSPSTVHSSVVDDSGLACSITASAGYGAGVLVPGTGIWLNNSLGEAELNKSGFHALTPGTRLPSNMAPTVGCSDAGGLLSIGSPGADRITSAIVQSLLNFAHFGMPLQQAVDHPRLHVERTPDGDARTAFEPGLPVPALDVPQRAFAALDMFFGGVGAVHFEAPDQFEMAADVRRVGGVGLSPPR
jgi:gamma-glutamyltranspeptidase/glutathione hydrolase